MGKSAFQAFLLAGNWIESQSKKFVDHAQTDASLSDVSSWEGLEAHLKSQSVPEDAIEEAKYIWERYVADDHGLVG